MSKPARLQLHDSGANVSAEVLNIDHSNQLAALSKSQAVIAFNMDGTIIKANDNFLKTLGYSMTEIQGKHHSIFVDPVERETAAYKEFWAKLNRGEIQIASFRRIAKDGHDVWIQASYNPIADGSGTLVKVVKYATDITKQMEESNDLSGEVAALSKSQAVIAFNMDGTIIKANDNFLKTLGYSMTEIQGKHHSIFVDPVERETAAYKEFWAKLNRGENQIASFRRIAKDGHDVWIQASYNPIANINGKLVKVVKYATDITKQMEESNDLSGQMGAISKSQAVIEFNMDGTIIKANDNFLKTLGYTLGEIEGKHHSMFVDQAERHGAPYKEFWAKLNRGENQIAEFCRIAKDGRNVWIQASYNPIANINGKFVKVVKYASEITAAVEAREATRQMTENMKQTLEAVARNAQSLSSASEELSATSQLMSSNSEETAAQANVVAAASEQVTTNVGTVATSAEEMSASVMEIAKNAGEAARVATQAVRVAEEANAKVNKLGESSIEIGKVIKVITSIAQQTNLLALNATIEAARAGEAGKGFAVVANEVKELAKQTARATEEIGQKIDAIQSDTKGAVEAISQIGGIITQINDIQNTIASAVEEQTATTSEIARNASEAAKGSTEISRNIGNVSEAARSTTEGAANTLTAAQELSRLASELMLVVNQADVR